ncbi:MAG: electron transfer flavoprotein-ubiquinone oxidoreductase, partial [Planctomycetes bacterium]|nr:electron transfer flavoprotein-ubiquinone oxidoreductase [Planctomycetota bacterium]
NEVIETDILIVGGGPAGLSCAIKLSQIFKTWEKKPEITVIEKAREFGSHQLSGAVFDPVSLNELLPNYKNLNPPLETLVAEEKVYYLTENDKFQLPIPPFLSNHDNYVISLSRLTRWLAEIAEKEGIMLIPDTPGDDLLLDDKGGVCGIVTKEKGIDKNGQRRSNYQEGIHFKAKVVILSEGTLGSLTRKAIKKYNLDAFRQPQIFATGVKELWKSAKPLKPGQVIHTLGYPLSSSEFGGAFLYTYQDNKFCIGLVIGLDYSNPYTDIHYQLQNLKRHPKMAGFFEGGELLEYGAKTIPEGGLLSVPKLYGDGFLILGDSGGLVNLMKLKGIHLAIKSGLLAAETVAEAFNVGDFSSEILKHYEVLVKNSFIWKELKLSRSFRCGFTFGPAIGLLNAGLSYMLGGFSPITFQLEAGYTHMKNKRNFTVVERYFDEKITFNKLTDVYYSQAIHEENSPSHLVIKDPSTCITKCKEEYGNPCENFCPANVYEYIKDKSEYIHINFSNCVHCKTCDIMDPYQVIEWVVPESGGPSYKNL